MTSPWVPHVMVAVSPRRAETVPRRRMVDGLEEEGWKAWRWAGRRRGVGRDIVADSLCFILCSSIGIRRNGEVAM